jgi:hypothetical protein
MNPIHTIISCVFLIALTIVANPEKCVADRLYTWTDEKGVSHITQHPPPAGAKNQNVIDYSQRYHQEQQAAAAGRRHEDEVQRQDDQVLPGDGKSIEQYRKEIREDLQEQAAEGKQTCYLQAPNRRAYVRVFSTNSYNEREKEIWDGWIEPNQRALIISPSEQIVYNRKWKEKGPFGGDNLRACSDGGLIQIPGM